MKEKPKTVKGAGNLPRAYKELAARDREKVDLEISGGARNLPRIDLVIDMDMHVRVFNPGRKI